MSHHVLYYHSGPKAGTILQTISGTYDLAALIKAFPGLDIQAIDYDGSSVAGKYVVDGALISRPTTVAGAP